MALTPLPSFEPVPVGQLHKAHSQQIQDAVEQLHADVPEAIDKATSRPFTDRGPWDAGTVYEPNDSVTHDGKLWVTALGWEFGDEPGVAGWNELSVAAVDDQARADVATKQRAFQVDAADHATLQDALDAAGAWSSTVYVRGTWVITDTLNVPANTAVVLDPDAVIDGTGLGTSYAVSAEGGFTDAQAVTSNLAVGATSVPVSSSAAFSVGDIVRIRSENQPNATQPKDGELCVVAAVDTGEITLSAGLVGAYTTADTATIERLTGADSISIVGGRWEGPASDGSRWGRFTACSRLKIDGVKLTGWAERGLNLSSCADATITSVTIDGSDQAGFGYGVTLSDATSWVIVSGSTFSRFRHAVAGGGTASNYGRVRFVRIVDNSFHGGRGVNSHSGGQFWTIADNHFQGGPGSSAGDQINWNGGEVVITGNTLIGSARHAILINPTHVPVRGITVADNTIIRPASAAIMVDASATALDTISIADNVIDSPGLYAIYLFVSGSGGSITDFAITGNVARGLTQHGIWLRATQGGVTWGTVSGNRVRLAAAVNGIRLLAQNDNDLERVAVTGNAVNGGDIGINGVSSTANCWIDGNIAIGSTAGVSGFAGAEVGTNLTS